MLYNISFLSQYYKYNYKYTHKTSYYSLLIVLPSAIVKPSLLYGSKNVFTQKTTKPWQKVMATSSLNKIGLLSDETLYVNLQWNGLIFYI